MLFNNNFSFEFGYTAGSVIVYNLLYNMDTFHVDASSLRAVDNVDISGVAYDMPMYGSKHIYLPATASVPYNIPHTLGANMYTTGTETITSGGETSSLTTITSGCNIKVTVVGAGTTSPSISLNTGLPNEIGAYYKLSFNAVVNSGTPTLKAYSIGSYAGLSYTIVNGYNEIILTTSTYSASAILILYFNGTFLFDVDITNELVEKLTIPIDASLSWFDVAKKERTTLTYNPNGGNAPEIVLNNDLSNGSVGWNLGTVATESLGELIFTGAAGYVYTPSSASAYVGRRISLSIEITEATSGTIKIFEGSGGTAYGTIGTHTDTKIAIGSAINLYSYNFVGKVTLVSVKEILPIEPRYFIKSPIHHSNIFTTDVPILAADITYLNSNPEAIAQLHTGTLIPELSFVNANVINWYPANEGILGGATITDIKTATTVPINNYVPDCWTNALVNNVNYGMSDFLVTKNPTTGVFTGMATAGTITGANDGRFLRAPKTIPVDKTILKDVETMSGNVDSVTITYTDLTTEVI